MQLRYVWPEGPLDPAAELSDRAIVQPVCYSAARKGSQSGKLNSTDETNTHGQWPGLPRQLVGRLNQNEYGRKR